MNIPLLLQIKEQILKEPLQFRMEAYYSRYNSGTTNIPNCRTAACIAGWAIAITQSMTPCDCKNTMSLSDVEMKAADSLELDMNDAWNLFLLESWPKEFRIEYDDTYRGPQTEKNIQQRALIAARRIDHFISTNGE